LTSALPGLGAWATQLKVNSRAARYALGAVLGPAPGAAASWRSGVLPSATSNGATLDLLVIADSPTPSMNVIVNPGQAVITRTGQGPYVGTLDLPGRIQLTPPDPSNSRVDLIVARIRDERLGDTTTGFTVEPIAGKPAAQPLVPQAPDGCLPLAQVTITPTTTQIQGSAVVDVRRSAAMRTGVGVLLPGDVASDPGAYAGQVRYRAGVLEAWDGTTWRATHQPAMFTAPVRALDGQNTNRSIANVALPDPGWPYRVIVQGSAELTTVGSRTDLFITLDAASANPLAVGVGPTNAGSWCSTQTGFSDVLTGTHTVLLTCRRIFNDGTWSSSPFNGGLFVYRFPA
jgi:hypothetical protein